MFKLTSAVVVIVLVLVVMLNCFTIVNVNHQASVSSFGKVKEGKVLEGFNWVLPWWKTDEYSLAYTSVNFDDLKVASQDKFKTNMDVSYTGRFTPNTADILRKHTGVAEGFINTHISTRIKSCLTKAGGNVESSQAFFEQSVQIQLSDYTLECVNDFLASEDLKGYELNTIQFSDIRLDPIVKQFMVKTKERQEAENQQESSLKIADLKAQEKTKIAEALAQSAQYEATAIETLAEANLTKTKKEAEGNVELSKSVTEELVQYIKANNWNGALPTHMLGEGTTYLVK